MKKLGLFVILLLCAGFTFQKVRRPASTPQRPINLTLYNDNGELGVRTNIHKGHGLRGEYFNIWPPEGAPDFVRVDPNINFEWPGDAPIGSPILPDDDFSERWTGFIEIPNTGTWTFTTFSDDGVRLWIDNTQVINNWTVHGLTEDNGNIFLSAGKYPIVLEHFNKFYSLTDDPGITTIKLLWTGPGIPRNIIPPAAFYMTASEVNSPNEWIGKDGRRYKLKVISSTRRN